MKVFSGVQLWPQYGVGNNSKKRSYVSSPYLSQGVDTVHFGACKKKDKESFIVPVDENNEIDTTKLKEQLTNIKLGQTGVGFQPVTVNKISHLVNNDNKDVLETMINAKGNYFPRFGDYPIVRFLKLVTPDKKETFKTLVAETYTDNHHQTEPRFDFSDIESLLQKVNDNNKGMLNILLKEKKQNLLKNVIPRFNSEQIQNLLEVHTSQNDKFMKRLVKEKKDGVWYAGRFPGSDIAHIVGKYNKHPQVVSLLVNEKSDDVTQSRFRSSDIVVLANSASKEALLTKLVKSKNIDNTKTRFNASQIKTLLDYNNSNKFTQEMMDSLLNLKTKDNKNYILSSQFVDKINKNYHDLSYLPYTLGTLKLIEKYKDNEKWVKETGMGNNFHLILGALDADNLKVFNNDKSLKFISKNIPDNAKEILIALEDKNFKGKYNMFINGDDTHKQLVNFKLENGEPVILSRENLLYSDDKRQLYLKKVFNDGSNVLQKINYRKDLDSYDRSVAISASTASFDDCANLVSYETIKPSEDKSYQHQINTYVRKNTAINKVSNGEVKVYGSEKQGFKNTRVVTSPDGTTTEQTIIQGPKGSGSTYKIIDKDGNVLLNQTRRHYQLDENHYHSVVNNQLYDTVIDDDKIVVSKVMKGIKSPLKTIEFELNDSQDKETVPPSMKKLYQQLPGDFFFKIAYQGLSLSDNYLEKNNAAYDKGKISMSKELLDNAFIFAHELGHAQDDISNQLLNEDKDLLDLYEKELSNYKKVASSKESSIIDYFINNSKGDKRGIQEVIAEANAITSGLINYNDSDIMMRGVILQKNFPKSIAYVANKLNEGYN